MEQGWNKLGHTRGDVLEPSPGSGMTIGGRHKHSKWLKRAKNGHFVAIRGSGGSKLVEHGWNKLGHIQGDAMEPFPRSGIAIGGAIGPQNGTKRPKMAICWP